MDLILFINPHSVFRNLKSAIKLEVFMQPALTQKQQRVLDYLQHEITSSGQAPSLRQAAADIGVSH